MKDLTALVKFMKQHGLVHLKQGDVELTLSPFAVGADAPKSKEKVVVVVDDRRGTSGQTRAEQEALFGKVFEGDFIGFDEKA